MAPAAITAAPAPTANHTRGTWLLDRVFPPHQCDDAWADEALRTSLASIAARDSVHAHIGRIR